MRMSCGKMMRCDVHLPSMTPWLDGDSLWCDLFVIPSIILLSLFLISRLIRLYCDVASCRRLLLIITYGRWCWQQNNDPNIDEKGFFSRNQELRPKRQSVMIVSAAQFEWIYWYDLSRHNSSPPPTVVMITQWLGTETIWKGRDDLNAWYFLLFLTQVIILRMILWWCVPFSIRCCSILSLPGVCWCHSTTWLYDHLVYRVLLSLHDEDDFWSSDLFLSPFFCLFTKK